MTGLQDVLLFPVPLRTRGIVGPRVPELFVWPAAPSAQNNPTQGTMIQLTVAGKRYGPRILFESVNWLITPNERAGIVGANGTGNRPCSRSWTESKAWTPVISPPRKAL